MRTSMQDSGVAFTPPPALEIDGRTIAVDDEGYLLDSADWDHALYSMMAESDGIVLADDHWIAINFLRDFYQEYGIAPELYLMQRALCKREGDCRWDRQYLRQLFPLHGARDACRYAGLPKPIKGSCG